MRKERLWLRTTRRCAPVRGTTNGGGSVDDATLRQLLAALRSANAGDFELRLEEGQGGLAGQLAKAFNDLADRRSSLTDELQRVALVVKRDGRLTERVSLPRARGAWKQAVEAVNGMMDDLVSPTTEIARVIGAVAEGDLSQKMDLRIDSRPLRGEFRRIGTTVNAMVDQLSSFADEVTRVAREVGTEGKLGGQAKVKGVSGVWKDLTDNVNLMASNLTAQVRDIAEVTTAVATGDLSKKISVDVKGEILELKNTINTMVDQLSSFADEVTRVAREVGTEGKLGGQARVRGVSGTWKDLTDNVNFMASNLTTQVRGIARVVTAVANGDLDRKFTIEAQGEVAELADTINSMIDTLRTFAGEVTRVAREVGTSGILGGQADVKGVSGVWKDLTDNVNTLAANLTAQVRNIADVTTAVATGDLSKKITVDVKGEVLELKNTINTMVDQLRSFADEVTRVAKEVGTEGELGGQAKVEGVSGTWKDLTDNVNTLADNLTNQVRNIADVTTAVAQGDLSKKITVAARGEILELKETINTMVDQLRSFAAEVTRVAREVGTEGILGGQARVEGVSGVWKDLTDNVNFMASNLTGQVRNIAEVTTAVAEGDLGRKITVDVKGEILQLKNTINTMVDQLSSFADEVTRVAREVGTEGKLGGQARVKGVSGTWKDLTDSVNTLADNLTSQVRNIAEVTTAVAQGDLSQKITVDARGEVQKLKSTINTMVDQLSSFAAEVTRVAKEVGTEGRLGGQADVKGVSGVWKDLTDNVNSMAVSLTTQVRAIADVSTAVTQGDMTRSIAVDAKGEVAELKDNINEMIRNLAETTRRNAEQDWLNSNLARFTGMMQGQRNLATVSRMIMSELTPLVGAHSGAFFIARRRRRRRRAEADLELCVQAAEVGREPVQDRRGARRPGRAREDGDPHHGGAAGLHPHRVRARRSVPAQHPRAAGALRGPDDGGDRARVVRAVQRDAPGVPRAADGVARHRHQRHPAEHAHRGAARAVPAADGRAAGALGGAAVAAGGAEALERRARDAGRLAEDVRGAAPAAAGRAPADERGARGEGAAARGAEQPHRDQEPRDRGRALGARGQGRTARALVEVQERVPGQHVARAAHAAQLDADPRAAVRGEPRGQPLREADRVRDGRSTRRAATCSTLINDILDLSKVEAGKMDVHVTDVALTDVRNYVERTFRPVAEEKWLQFSVEIDEASAPADVRDRRAAAAAGAEEPALERVQVHRKRRASRSRCRSRPRASASRRRSCATRRPSLPSRSPTPASGSPRTS